MPLYRNDSKIILFIHIPKTGGSTVEEVLKNAGAAQALKYYSRLGYSNCTPQHMAWDVTRYWISAAFYDYAMTVVRNPYTRLASEYRWRESISKQPLPEFDVWVKRQLDGYAKNPYILDNHIRPQAEFVGTKVEIFRLEDGLDAPVKAGLSHLDLPFESASIHHAHKSEHKPLWLHRPTLTLIKQFYGVDFRTFGYDPAVLSEDVLKIKPGPPAARAVNDPAQSQMLRSVHGEALSKDSHS